MLDLRSDEMRVYHSAGGHLVLRDRATPGTRPHLSTPFGIEVDPADLLTQP